MRTFCAAALVAVSTVTLLGRQQSAPAPATQSTGHISGTVVDGRAQPVRSAIVSLTGASLGPGRGAITDDNGRFSFNDLPAGRFTLTSSKPSYLPSAYGATRPGGAGTPIALAAGEKVDLTISMPRGSAITGVVRDSHGAPVPAILVAVARANARTSTTATRPETVSTDDRGVYRIYGLPPGRYLVYADRGLSGGIGGVGMMSVADVDATFARLKQRVSGAPSVSQASPSSVVRPTSTFTPAPVFHPGVTSPAAAVPVEVALEQVREGIDIVYHLAPTVIVTGSISGAGTQNVQIGLIPDASNVQSGLGFGSGPMLERRAGTGDGPFTFTNVLPGRYTLTARTSLVTGRAGGPAPPAGPLLSASSIVEVTTSDITGLALALQRMPTVSGYVIFEGTSAPQAETLSPLTIQINPVGATTTPGGSVIGASIAPVQPDGTFHMPAVQPGSYRLAAVRGPAGWTLRSARLAGRDVLDLPLEVTHADVSGLEIRLSDRQTRLTGRLLQTDGTPAPGYFIVAFSADRAAWFPDSRRIQSVRPGTDGGFRFDNLPAGEYYLAALIDADSAEWQSPDFLEQVIPSAVRFAIGDGEQKIQDLRIRRPGH